MEEQFVRIEGFTDYLAGSLGSIINRHTGHTLLVNRGGVELYRGGEKHKVRAGRIIADAFKIPPMHTFDWVLHKDGDDSNNRPENLYRGSASDMLNDVIARGSHRTASRMHCNKGHEYTDENTKYKVRKDGRRERVCITCRRAYQNERTARNKGLKEVIAK